MYYVILLSIFIWLAIHSVSTSIDDFLYAFVEDKRELDKSKGLKLFFNDLISNGYNSLTYCLKGIELFNSIISLVNCIDMSFSMLILMGVNDSYISNFIEIISFILEFIYVSIEIYVMLQFDTFITNAYKNHGLSYNWLNDLQALFKQIYDKLFLKIKERS